MKPVPKPPKPNVHGVKYEWNDVTQSWDEVGTKKETWLGRAKKIIGVVKGKK